MIPFESRSIPLDAVDEPAVPLRENIAAEQLGDLADDMAVNGLLQPIGARGPAPDGRYECVWGHRRMLAARLLGWSEIPARVCPWPTAPELARVAENLMRADLNPREEARAIAAFRGQGRAFAEIARIMRRSVGWVEARAELLTWPDELQDAVVAGTLSFAVARQLAEIDHALYRQQLVDEAARTGATSSVVAVWLAHYAADRDRIVRNAETVEQIVTRRESFTVLALCDACRQNVDSRTTSMLRVCPSCLDELREQQRLEDQERRQASQPG